MMEATAARRACSAVLPAAGSRSESTHCRASLLDLRMASASNCRSPEPIGQQPVELAASSDKKSSRFPDLSENKKKLKREMGAFEEFRPSKASPSFKQFAWHNLLETELSPAVWRHEQSIRTNCKRRLPDFIGKCTVLIWSSLREKPCRHGELRRLGCLSVRGHYAASNPQGA